MSTDAHLKIRPSHLQRIAYLYVRQSSLRQVLENSESTKRQYDLRGRAVALGWQVERIVVIDDDLGKSGSSSLGRDGFQRLVAEVGLGRAGIVMGLEVSRLARNSTDWHRLLEICAVTDTLILDEDGVYDPAHFNDRLLLGLKGTMSEAELHVLRARLRGGILNKARRGELEMRLPIGFVYTPEGRVALDPDVQVREAIRAVFRLYRETGAAIATVKAFRQRGLLFPRRVTAPSKYRPPGELVWRELDHDRALWLLHHPRYAGAFCFGRTRQRRLPDGRAVFATLPRDQWTVLLRDAHAGYVTWEEFEENQRRLADSKQAFAPDRPRSPPREGPALLQGLVLCGRCGRRMTIRYDIHRGRVVPIYTCQREGIRRAEPFCQRLPGAAIDAAVAGSLAARISPRSLELTIAVRKEVEARIGDADDLRARQVERARHDADLARRRVMQVHPDNRLVIDALEAHWNEKLRDLGDAQDAYERHKAEDQRRLDGPERAAILSLATTFPKVWSDPAIPDREKKRIVRLLVEDVTLLRNEQVIIHVRFRGGTTESLTLPPPRPAWALRKTSKRLVAEIDRLIDDHTDSEIAAILDAGGFHSGEGLKLHRLAIRRIRLAYQLRGRRERLLARGLLTLREVADKLGLHTTTVKVWRQKGYIRAHVCDDRGEYLYEIPGTDAPKKFVWKERGPNALIREPAPVGSDGRQCAT